MTSVLFRAPAGAMETVNFSTGKVVVSTNKRFMPRSNFSSYSVLGQTSNQTGNADLPMLLVMHCRACDSSSPTSFHRTTGLRCGRGRSRVSSARWSRSLMHMLRRHYLGLRRA